ncbi:MAG: DUF2497 domain-containing protein [Pseudomonadota bacterium]
MTGKVNNAAIDLQSGAARTDAPAVSEPTMEEILASIREIISEDEPDDGLTPRERYQHPSDVSNANAPSAPAAASVSTEAEPTLQSTVDASVQQRAEALKAEISSVAAPTTASVAVTPSAPVGGVPVGVAPVSSPAVGGSIAGDGDADMLEIERLANAIRAREAGGQQSTKPVPEVQIAATADVAPIKAAPASYAAQPQFTPNAPPRAPVQPLAAPQPETSEIADSVARMMLDEHGDELRAALSELMQPVVRKWLGDNLPTMVERLVRDEIERASRGR